MTLADLDEGLELVRQLPQDLVSFHGPRNDDLIETAAKQLGVRLSPTYREFLRRTGGGSVADEEFYGIVKNAPEEIANWGVVWATARNRDDYGQPHGLITLGAVMWESEIYVLDTSSLDDQGEAPVMIWDPDPSSSERGLGTIIASDFGSFFRDRLRVILAEQGPEGEPGVW